MKEYKGQIIDKTFPSGYYESIVRRGTESLGRVRADTLQGIKRLITEKLEG